MDRLRRLLDLTVGGLCCGLLLALVVVLAWQVVSRYVLNTPSSVTEEVLRYGVIWMSMLGAAYAVGQGSHLSIDLLRGWLPRPWQLRLEGLVVLAFTVFAGVVLIWGGMRGVQISARQTSAVLRIPMSWIYLSLPLSGAVMLLYAALNLGDLLHGRSRHVPSEDMAELPGE